VDTVLRLVEVLSRAHTETTCAQAACEVLGAQALEIVLEPPDGAPRRFVVGDRDARGRGAVFALTDVAGVTGRARVVGASAPPAFGVILSAALRQVHAIARVAEASRRAHRASRELGDRLREATLPASIVAVAPATRRVFHELVPAVARRDVTVLVTGETGTGKEVVAQRIHDLSGRAKRAIVRVNCGAIPGELVESTLFGHERGAFTGAVRRQIGVFERAHTGTLFLDEIGELPLAAQAKLLRVLETGLIERVGGDRTIAVDARVIAASHRDLERLAREGSFRDDLYYRLSVFPIHVPPLRERSSEIAVLARRILGELAGERAPRLDRRTIARLRAYTWPGNVRELRNVLERGLLLMEGGELRVDLPLERRADVTSFADTSRRCIEGALVASRGRIYGASGAAALLGLKPTTLASKMKRLGVRSPLKTEAERI
jgi:transcriptional regulator with GAF, ATPase, and Fis domain